jgi:hypothetical protein
MNQKQVGNQIYYGGIGSPDGFGHGHYNGNSGYNRPAIGGDSVINALGWTAVMGATHKQVDVGGRP